MHSSSVRPRWGCRNFREASGAVSLCRAEGDVLEGVVRKTGVHLDLAERPRDGGSSVGLVPMLLRGNGKGAC